jgi:hypothetical protein
VSSSRGGPLLELRVLFEKAKKYTPGIISIISPSAASSSSAPASSTPASSAPVPPLEAAATSAAPTSATEHDAEVA